MVPDNSTTTLLPGGKLSNPGARRRFLDAYHRGRPAQWQYVLTTTEGDPFSYRLLYDGDGRSLRLLYDNTQDEFSAAEDRRVRQYDCEALRDAPKRLQLLRCTGDGAHRVTLTVP
jgi:hypothetical protein